VLLCISTNRNPKFNPKIDGNTAALASRNGKKYTQAYSGFNITVPNGKDECVMTAPVIVGSTSILFLGAGASQPYGKMLMADFVVHSGPRNLAGQPFLFRTHC
jgi:hypothetical protein